MTDDRDIQSAVERVRLRGIGKAMSKSSDGVGVFLTAFVVTLVLLIGGLTWAGFALWGWVR